MKKTLFLSIVTILVAFAAGAQNKTIDELAAKYTDRDGVTVITIDGDMIKMLGDGAVNLEGMDLSGLAKDIRTMTVIISELNDGEFTREVKVITDADDYKPLVSSSNDNETVKVLVKDLKGKGGKNDKEVVVSVINKNDDSNVLVRVIGDIDIKNLEKLTD